MTFAYDAVGNRSQRTDYNNAVTNYTSDALNRLTTIGYPDTTSATYGYDVLARQQNSFTTALTLSVILITTAARSQTISTVPASTTSCAKLSAASLPTLSPIILARHAPSRMRVAPSLSVLATIHLAMLPAARRPATLIPVASATRTPASCTTAPAGMTRRWGGLFAVCRNRSSEIGRM